MDRPVEPQWLVLAVRVPAEPTRHRVAVWRELRRVGALLLGQATWAAPEVPGVAAGISRAVGLATRGGGEILVLRAVGRSAHDGRRLQELFTAQRQDEWLEFIADGAKFDVEIDKEIRINKLTFAELEEEEQSLERLKRWHRTIKARDVFGAEAAGEADRVLELCTRRLAEYTQLVFTAQHQT
ncbi:Chromate resistance protein ChrB [Nakamurella sp. PAMC28650]|jgi:hypothetical protein|uniref:Chromate resistance protein ChrB n=1 Tax=Nakamurella sp. PAMC28650 TaxID=2762325 RepID=UPI00164E6425|nr:Chromate resistance protein ChrB [Nakamurella sp. PAMC28650]QNK80314.1 chromate resistance protein ChrB [Nakamurella sp. PAMC28650]